MVDLTEQLARDNGVLGSVRVSTADAHDLPFADGAFMLAVGLGVGSWLHSRLRVMEETARVPITYLTVPGAI
jgi:hypothetical protein